MDNKETKPLGDENHTKRCNERGDSIGNFGTKEKPVNVFIRNHNLRTVMINYNDPEFDKDPRNPLIAL